MWAFNGEIYSYMSKEWYNYTGQDAALPLTIERWSELVHPEDLEAAEKIWMKNWEAKTAHENYFRLKRKDGEYRYFHCHATPIFNEDGSFKHFQGFNLDITERLSAEQAGKHAQENLLESENNLRTLFNAMSDVVFEMDYDGRYINIAPTSPELIFKPSDDLIGKTLH